VQRRAVSAVHARLMPSDLPVTRVARSVAQPDAKETHLVGAARPRYGPNPGMLELEHSGSDAPMADPLSSCAIKAWRSEASSLRGLIHGKGAFLSI